MDNVRLFDEFLERKFPESRRLPLPRFPWNKRRCKLLNGGRADNDGHSQPLMKRFVDSCEDAGHLNRSASQFEEVDLYPYGRALQHLLPDADMLSFQDCSWGDSSGQDRPFFSWLRLRRAARNFFAFQPWSMNARNRASRVPITAPSRQLWWEAQITMIVQGIPSSQGQLEGSRCTAIAGKADRRSATCSVSDTHSQPLKHSLA